MEDIKTIALDFITALQNRNSAADFLHYYHPDIEQIEFPNTLTKFTTIRNLQALKEASEKGKKILLKENYEVTKSYSFENTVIIELIWTGTLAIPLGNIPAGGQMKAYFAQFYEFRQGKIIKQRNYDCFEPFN